MGAGEQRCGRAGRAAALCTPTGCVAAGSPVSARRSVSGSSLPAAALAGSGGCEKGLRSFILGKCRCSGGGVVAMLEAAPGCAAAEVASASGPVAGNAAVLPLPAAADGMAAAGVSRRGTARWAGRGHGGVPSTAPRGIARPKVPCVCAKPYRLNSFRKSKPQPHSRGPRCRAPRGGTGTVPAGRCGRCVERGARGAGLPEFRDE